MLVMALPVWSESKSVHSLPSDERGCRRKIAWGVLDLQRLALAYEVSLVDSRTAYGCKKQKLGADVLPTLGTLINCTTKSRHSKFCSPYPPQKVLAKQSFLAKKGKEITVLT